MPWESGIPRRTPGLNDPGTHQWSVDAQARQTGPGPVRLALQRSGCRLVQDLPGTVLGVDEQERLDRLAIGRTADLAEQTVGLFQCREPRAHLLPIRGNRVRLTHDLLGLDHVLQDERDLISRGAVQISAAAEFCNLFSRLGGS